MALTMNLYGNIDSADFILYLFIFVDNGKQISILKHSALAKIPPKGHLAFLNSQSHHEERLKCWMLKTQM